MRGSESNRAEKTPVFPASLCVRVCFLWGLCVHACRGYGVRVRVHVLCARICFVRGVGVWCVGVGVRCGCVVRCIVCVLCVLCGCRVLFVVCACVCVCVCVCVVLCVCCVVLCVLCCVFARVLCYAYCVWCGRDLEEQAQAAVSCLAGTTAAAAGAFRLRDSGSKKRRVRGFVCLVTFSAQAP
jgi:hypothetical protein